MNAPTHAETLIERRSANQALLESRLGEAITEIRYLATICKAKGYVSAAVDALAVASRSEDALRTIREGDAQ